MPVDEKMLFDLLKDFKDEIIQSADHRIVQFRDDIKKDFRHQLGVQGEDFQHKLDLVIEGQQALSEKIDRVESNLKEEIRKVDQRMTGLGAEPSEHRRDTEAHRKGWRVRED